MARGGTAREDDLAEGGAVGFYLDRRVGPVSGDHCFVGKPLQTGRHAFRSRPVADASGAPVLRDQGPDRPAGHSKADQSVG
jgi:hypothetical protein